MALAISSNNCQRHYKEIISLSLSVAIWRHKHGLIFAQVVGLVKSGKFNPITLT